MKHSFRYIVINSIIIFILVLLISSSGLFKGINNSIYDTFLLLNKDPTQQNQIVIIEIDDKSIEELGSWPWKRKLYAELIDYLYESQAKIAGFYLNFTFPTDKLNDQALFSSMKKLPVVVLNPYTLTPGEPETLFWKEIKYSSRMGHNIIRKDTDSIIRNHSPLLNNKPSFTFLILNLFDKNRFSISKNKEDLIIQHKLFKKINSQKLPVNYKKPWFQFTHYSFVDVLKNKISPKAFKNKIVLIGLTKEGLTEFYMTPFSKEFTFSGNIAPIFIQAQIIDSLLNYDLLYIFPPHYINLFLILFIPAIIIITRKFNILWQGIILMLIFPALLLILSSVAFKFSNLWCEPVSFMLSSMLLFIIIAIESVFNVSRFLDKYIYELSGKVSTDKSLNIDPSVDEKLLTLKEITDIIEKDRFIFDTVLTSVDSFIILLDNNGNVVYTNSKSKNFNTKSLLDQIDFSEIKESLDKIDIYKKNISIKGKHFEFISNKASKNLYAGVFNDITDMIKINETKSTIIRMLSHEMKTPLATILLTGDLVFSINQDPFIEKSINKMIDQAEFIKELINSFLELNKLDIADITLKKSPVDLNELIMSIINELDLIAQKKEITLIYTGNQLEKAILTGDRKYLHIMLKNLIDNSIKYSPANTTISIACDILPHETLITITDQGFGIAPEDLERLFDSFYRVKNDKTENIAGSGLGLSFVKKIIELHNGEIKVESVVDQGSTFKLIFNSEN